MPTDEIIKIFSIHCYCSSVLSHKTRSKQQCFLVYCTGTKSAFRAMASDQIIVALFHIM